MRRLTPLLFVFAACGDDGHARSIDAPVSFDAPPDVAIDAAVDAPLVDAPPSPLDHHHYVMDRLLVPTTNNQARQYGLDLNGDNVVDNQLGMVLATLGSMGFDIQAATDAQVDQGQILELFDLGTSSFTTDPAATFNAFVGATPMPAPCNGTSDTVCRHHLAGTGTFTVAPTSPMNPALTGAFTAGTLTTTSGHLVAPITMFTPPNMPLYITLVGARVQLSAASDPRVMQMKLTGGVTQTDIDQKVIPAMREGIQAQVVRDCTMPANPPGCGCASGSGGKTWLDLFDGDVSGTQKDCSVSVQEVRESSLIQSLLAPDVMLESQMCLSYGIGATAIAAGFVAP